MFVDVSYDVAEEVAIELAGAKGPHLFVETLGAVPTWMGVLRRARNRTVRSLSDRISDFRANPQDWERVSSSAVPSTNRRARGGVSIENVYRNKTTGETIHVHDVFDSSGNQIPKHPSFRDFGKEK